ncbi:unnamed protein product [Urochloa decumbens]|uniref:KIB1-4 beta-propeller domain-containing protein n=1 Tax=Urochloa decumbens TaxID=240449 RepID=A0ABC9AUV7_9POAL
MGARPSKSRQSTTANSPPLLTGFPPSTLQRLPELPPCTSSPWMDLQPDLVDLVLRRLTSHTDRVRFAAVCRHWRYTVREYSLPVLPPVLPWISFPRGAIESLTLRYDDVGERHFFAFREEAVSSGSFSNWQLFRKEERGRPNRLHYYLRNPLSSAALMRLPDRCEELVHLKPDGSYGVSSIQRSSSEFEISDVIVCSNDLIAAIVSYPHHLGIKSVVVCCRPGMSSWSRGLYNRDHWYMDMAFYKEKIYAVTREGHLVAHEVVKNSHMPTVCQIEEVILAPSQSNSFFTTSFNNMSCYLVISHTGKLLMVRWVSPYGNNREGVVKVFEADLETSQWIEVKSLDGQVLFVSRNCSKAFSVSGHGGCLKGDRIYFVDYSLIRSCLQRSDKLACVYYMRCKKLVAISLGQDISSEPDASWFFP